MSTMSPANQMTAARELRAKKQVIATAIALIIIGLAIIDYALYTFCNAVFNSVIAEASASAFVVILCGGFIVVWGLNLVKNMK